MEISRSLSLKIFGFEDKNLRPNKALIYANKCLKANPILLH